jgi:hypothetical protein
VDVAVSEETHVMVVPKENNNTKDLALFAKETTIHLTAPLLRSLLVLSAMAVAKQAINPINAPKRLDQPMQFHLPD